MTKRNQIYNRLFQLIEDGERVALVSVASMRSSAPHETHTMMIVKEDGGTIGSVGGGDIELYLVKRAQEIIQNGKPERILVGVNPEEEKKRGMESGGKLKFFIESMNTIPAIYLFGAGSLTVSLSKMGSLMGFKVIVIDNDPYFANVEKIPDADLLFADGFENLTERFDLNDSSYVIIATRDHRYDETVLFQVLKSQSKYIGLIKSEKNTRALFSRLKRKGISDNMLHRVYAPIGLKINASTLDEIALSVMAEIISVRRTRVF